MKQIFKRRPSLVLLFAIGILFSVYSAHGKELSARALMEACRLGDLETVKAELEKGVDLEAQDGSNWTSLFHALDAGQGEVARFLIDRGADFTQMLPSYEYPLNLAIRGSKNDTVAYLILKGAPLHPEEYEDSRGRSPLFSALVWGDSELLQILEENGADWLDWEHDDVDALSLAAKFNNSEAVRYLIDLGADVNQRAPDGNFPLALAAFEGHLAMVKLLLANGAEINAISRGSMNVDGNRAEPHTALVGAVRDNNLGVVNVLLSAGADPAQIDNLAIKYADFAGNLAIYDRLLEAGVPEPEPYSFTKINRFEHIWRQQDVAMDSEDGVEWIDLSILNNPSQKTAEESPVYNGPPVTVAVIPSRAEVESAEILVTAELTEEPSFKLLERAQLQQALKEISLQRAGLVSAESSIQAGQLLGADCLILLDQEGDTLEARIISTATGLVLRVLVGDTETMGEWVGQIRRTLTTKAPLLHSGTEGLTLVSIPRITSIQGGPNAIDQERILSRALAIYLGSLDNIFVLDRQNMLQLAGEKILTEDVRRFYSSGWLIDGGFDQVGDNLSITLRLRQPETSEEVVLTAGGKASQPREILQSLRDQVGEALEISVTESEESVNEAELYLTEARKAYRVRQFESAQHAADAAWALGNGFEEATSLRLLSRLRRLGLAENLIKGRAEEIRWGGPIQVIAYRTPFLLARQDPRELTARQFITLSQDIMDIYRPLAARKSGFSALEKDLLMYFSEAIKGAILPLKFLNTVSDQKFYRKELETLREGVLRTSLDLLEIAEKNQYPHLRQTILNSYLFALPYLLRDENELYCELEERMNEASAMKAPLSKHNTFAALLRIAEEQMNTVGGQPGTAWQRMALRMIDSDNPDARYLGHALMRRDRHDYQGRVADCEAMVPLYFQLVTDDDSLWGISANNFDPEINTGLQLKNSFRVYPEYAMSMWYPSPYELSLSLSNSHGPYRISWMPPGEVSSVLSPDYARAAYQMNLARIQSASKTGSAAVDYGFPLNGIDLDQLKILKELSEDSLEQLKIRSEDKDYMEKTVYRFNSYVVRPIEEAYVRALQDQKLRFLERDKSPKIYTSQFQTPLFAREFLNQKNERARRSLQEFLFFHGSTCVTSRELWILDRNHGVFRYNVEQDTISEAIFFPIGKRLRVSSDFMGEKLFSGSFIEYPNLSREKESAGIGIFHRGNGKWDFINPERVDPDIQRSYEGIQNTVIIGQELFYSFLNLAPNAAGARFEVLKDTRTSSGVSRIDLESGREILLASSNRTPAKSPLDNVRPDSFNFYEIGPISGNLLRVNKHVYNPVTDEWRRKKRRDELETRQSKDSGSFHKLANEMLLRRADYDPKERVLKALIEVYQDRERKISFEIDVPLELTGWLEIEIPNELPEAARYYEKNLDEPDFSVSAAGEGLILSNSLGFYFIHFDQLYPIFEDRMRFLIGD
ncbi:MAG: ankyrin repeat domain-containing protein [Verrucomicrobiota bacterium]